MKRHVFNTLIAVAGIAAAGVASAADAPGDPTMRNFWRTHDVASIDAVQQVFTRVASFKLPRPFILVNSGRTSTGFIAEYVPDGQTVVNWTRMVTVTGTLGVGRAAIDDVALAARLEPKDCPGKVFRDLGPTAPFAGVTGRRVVLGCGLANQPGAERGVVAVFRDTENVWTIQYAERNHGTPPFAPDQALARLAAIAPAIIPRAPATPR